MWRILPYAGALVHAFAGSWTTLMAATPANPANLCSLGFQVLGPGLAELAVAVLITMACSPRETVLPVDIRA